MSREGAKRPASPGSGGRELSPLVGEGELSLPRGETVRGMGGGGDPVKPGGGHGLGARRGLFAGRAPTGALPRASEVCRCQEGVGESPVTGKSLHPASPPGACRAPGAGGAGGSAAGADSRAGGGGAGPGPARWNPDQMYPARQECSASPPGPAAAPRLPPRAPHREPPRSPPLRHPPGLRPSPIAREGPGAGRDPERLWGDAEGRVMWGSRCGGWWWGFPGRSVPPSGAGHLRVSQDWIPTAETPHGAGKGVFPGRSGKKRGPTPGPGVDVLIL